MEGATSNASRGSGWGVAARRRALDGGARHDNSSKESRAREGGKESRKGLAVILTMTWSFGGGLPSGGVAKLRDDKAVELGQRWRGRARACEGKGGGLSHPKIFNFRM
jgi:hypothetical protein